MYHGEEVVIGERFFNRYGTRIGRRFHDEYSTQCNGPATSKVLETVTLTNKGVSESSTKVVHGGLPLGARR